MPSRGQTINGAIRWISWLLLLQLFVQCTPLNSGDLANSDPETSTQIIAELTQPPNYWQLETEVLSYATVYRLAIPSNAAVYVAQSETLQTVETFAKQTGAMAALNAGFFDPNNGQTTSHVWVEGLSAANPAENQRLVGNPDLTSYLNQILNRSEFRRYDCQGTWRYDIALHTADVPQGCQLVDAVGAGPQLLPQDLSAVEGFTAYDNGVLVRDAIGSQQRNARSAVGLRANGQVVFVMVAQTQPSDGMTLAELAGFMAEHGIVKALNLDGGSSSSLVFEGDAYYGRLDVEGRTIQRPIKSVLWVSQP